MRKDGVHADPGLFIPAFYDIGGRGFAVSSIVIPAWDANTIVVAGRAGVWRSDDNGANWHTIFNGLQGRRMLSAAIQPGTSRFYFGMVDFAMGTYDAVSRKFDPVDVKEILGTNERNIAVAVDAAKTKIMAGMGNQYANEGNFGTVIASTDGEHWVRKDQGLPGKRVSGLKMAPSRPDTVYAALNGAGIYKSTNGGESWTAASHGLPGVDSLFSSFTRVPIAVHPQNPDIVYALDDSQGVFRSMDGGASWQRMTAGIKPAVKLRYEDLAIDPTAPDTAYVSTSEGMYRSTDGGSHWEPEPIPHTGDIGSITVSPVDGAVFAAADADPSSPADTVPGVYMSADKGATWTAIYGDGPAGIHFDALLIDPDHPDDLYATVRTASMIKLSER